MIKKESMKPQQTNSSSSMASASTMFHNLQESKEDNALSPPIKRSKCEPKNMVDVCVGTSIGTITEPDCLGPCEPGTSVTLEGIVWHETEGGVLAVNVTWRGKTYVGTLIDCTKHDWAPPRFCDSPTEDLESRMQKSGRSKRARNSTTSNHELMNFTETRSSVSDTNFSLQLFLPKIFNYFRFIANYEMGDQKVGHQEIVQLVQRT